MSESFREETTLSHEDRRRYARHLVLPSIGEQGQLRLKNARALVVGVGGLGSAISMYLAGAGVGHIGLVDHDTVDLSNLQRQVLHGTSTLGQRKTDSAGSRIHDLNPDIEIHMYPAESQQTTT
jgi:sulfur-carrier protein adenylyltransferase/sulfurtransferase